MLISLILITIEKPGTKIKKTNAHLNFDLKWVNVTLLLHFFENHPDVHLSCLIFVPGFSMDIKIKEINIQIFLTRPFL